jgi:AcrR family transcriptional regulator
MQMIRRTLAPRLNVFYILNTFNMSLFDEHKAERKERIIRAARKLVAERGYDGLTMRDLAHAARVSVPTLYNLFGSKDAILVAELQIIASRIAAGLPDPSDGHFARAMTTFEAGMRLIEASPEFFRACIRMFFTSPASDAMRRRTEDGYIAIMVANLSAAKAAGQLADWAAPVVVARHLFALYMSSFMAWGIGELDFASFRATALSGACHLLAGVARGRFAADVEARIRQLEPNIYVRKEVADAKTGD